MTPAPSAEADIHCEGLVRIFTVADIEVQALQGLDLFVGRGELVALVGASGSGKSTLLAILSGLDTPTAGKAVVAGRDLPSLTNRDRVAYRRDVVGFVWQQTARNLLPYLSALENVELLGGLREVDGERVVELLDFGWKGRGAEFPGTLFHANRVLLEREDDTWKIVSESHALMDSCGFEASDERPDYWRYLQERYTRLVEECEGRASLRVGGRSRGCDLLKGA